jgi:hypothetical protein
MHSCSKCRYVVAALLVSKGKQESRSDKWASQLDQIRKLIQNEEYQYSDPVTDFVKAVFCSYDFDLAQVRCPTQLGCYFLIPFHNCPLYLYSILPKVTLPKVKCKAIGDFRRR